MDPKSSLRVGDVLNRVFELYKEHFGVLIPAAFWLFLLVSILSGIVGQHDVGLLLLVAVVSFAVAILYQGMVVSLVHDVQDGRRDSSVGELFSGGRKKRPSPDKITHADGMDEEPERAKPPQRSARAPSIGASCMNKSEEYARAGARDHSRR